VALRDTLQADLQQAMRAGDVVQREMLRMLLTALRNEEVARRGQLTPEEEQAVLRREIKRREEALPLFRQGKREDLVAKAEAEIAVIRSYLPEELDEQALVELAQAAIREVGAKDVRQMGQVMKVLMPRVQGRADGSVVSQVVRRLLAGK
jgi:uncharacterized protein YqeY